MNNSHNQAGLTLIGWMFLLLIAGFFVFTGLKLYPHYYEYFAVRSVVQHQATLPEIKTMTKPKLWLSMTKGFRLENIKSVKREDMYITYNKKTKQKTVGVAYERRIHLYLNIDAVLVFKSEIEV